MSLFKKVSQDVNLPELEERVLRLWAETDAFNVRRRMNRGRERWSFLDGPITANNPMGVHHAWGRTYKDLFQRFHAMMGCDIRYQNGFDCQGLWVEVEVEKALGFKSKQDIEKYGVSEFIKNCKQRVLRYAAKQTEQSIRLGYWMEWNDPAKLRALADALDRPDAAVEYAGEAGGKVTGTPEQVIGQLGSLKLGGSYFTMADTNNYGIWAVIKKCHERGLVYKGIDVMPWCPRCSTALSEHEIATEGYREVAHTSMTVRMPIRERPGESLLVWTTTPWTLTSNVAVAVNPNMTYVKVRQGGSIYYAAKAAAQRLFGKDYEVLGEVLGGELEGLTYDGPFDELPAVAASGAPKRHKVIPWAEVSEEEGTGMVHIAPGCGKEDHELGREFSLPALSPINEFGEFIGGFGPFTGIHVYSSVEPVKAALKDKGILFKAEKYRHRYPFCWRCSNELVFRLVDEWFISMGERRLTGGGPSAEPEDAGAMGAQEAPSLREQISGVTRQVTWVPAFGLSQELDWLQNMSDWMISKKRYWGLALPIWACGSCGSFDVIGSREELKSRATSGWESFEGHSPHKPWIDMVKIRCPKCGSEMSRVPDVGNPWLDAGIVAYSTAGYFEDRKYWSEWIPADLICESLPGQFRNWFYSLLTMSTILENRPPTKAVFGFGTVLAEDGREMHKSWGNAIWFDDAAKSMGADVMRWMYCTSRPEADLLFGYKRAEEVKKEFIIPLWNIYSFFVTYAELDRWTPSGRQASYTQLDRWILSKLQVLIRDVTSCLEGFDPAGASTRIGKFVDLLSQWYIRRSRRRFWKSESDGDKEAAYSTLYSCITTLLRLLAPFVPFVTEEIYQNVVRSIDSGAPASVHHCSWPKPDDSLIDAPLMASMDAAIRACSLGHSVRSASGVKVRQPLEKAMIFSDAKLAGQMAPLEELIKEELNVKRIEFGMDKESLVDFKIRPLPRLLGVKHGRALPKILAAVETMNQSYLAALFRAGKSVQLNIDGKQVELLPTEVEIQSRPKQGFSMAEESGLAVAVDVSVTEALKEEGFARDIVRRIQNQRKESGFEISDRIEVYYSASPKLASVFSRQADYIAAETLAAKLDQGPPPPGIQVCEYEIEGEKFSAGLVRLTKA